jgi:hypothetical protein
MHAEVARVTAVSKSPITSLFIAFIALDLLPCVTPDPGRLFTYVDTSVSGTIEGEDGRIAGQAG